VRSPRWRALSQDPPVELCVGSLSRDVIIRCCCCHLSASTDLSNVGHVRQQTIPGEKK